MLTFFVHRYLRTSGTHIFWVPEYVRMLIVYDRAMVRDESLYPDAHSFKPERFLEEIDAATERRRDPRAYVFGFGRRCVSHPPIYNIGDRY